MSDQTIQPNQAIATIMANGAPVNTVRDNPLCADLVVVDVGGGFIQGMLADVRTLVESALAGLDEVERQRADVAEVVM